MEKNEGTGSPGSWGASLWLQTTEDVARAVVAATAAATAARSPRPSVVFSLKEDSGSPLEKFQRHVSNVLKGLSQTPEEKGRSYNPEVLTSQKRQWASFQLQSLDHRIQKEPSRLFESMVVVGLHPDCDAQALQRQYFGKKSEGSGRFRNALGGPHQSRIELNLEPQVLFVYPPDKPLPIKYQDLLSFCFPGGVEVHAVERTPSMSELNEILLGQEHFKQNDLSFVFRLQVADDSALYGCCVLVDEILRKPSGIISMISNEPSSQPALSRHILTTRRCYCILSRLPFFELHFGVLNSIFTEERLERLTKSIGDMDLEPSICLDEEDYLEEKTVDILPEPGSHDMPNETTETPHLSKNDAIEYRSHSEQQFLHEDLLSSQKDFANDTIDPGTENLLAKKDYVVDTQISDCCDIYSDDVVANKQLAQKRLPNATLPLLRHHHEISQSSSSVMDGASKDSNLRSDIDLAEIEEATFSGQEDPSEHLKILDWAKANNHGSLQIIYEYYRLRLPARGSTIKFHPLEHLQALEFHRPDETVFSISGSTIDLKSCSTNLELAEAVSVLVVEEEATALSVWAVACICGSLRLDHVLTIFAAALLEKQIVFVCSNLGILSASVLSVIPLIRPYHWQSLLMPVLPNDMLDFLDAPVPYIVGVKNKTSEMQSKLSNVVLVDLNKNQVRSPTIPQLPQQKELFSALSPYHQKLVGESYLGRRRPVYECTDVQVEAATGFLGVLRSYLDSLCSNLRSHTITNVQSNDDKVSLLLKESFIDSFSNRDRHFLKYFVDTQLFSVHTDLVLSFFQKE